MFVLPAKEHGNGTRDRLVSTDDELKFASDAVVFVFGDRFPVVEAY